MIFIVKDEHDEARDRVSMNFDSLTQVVDRDLVTAYF